MLAIYREFSLSSQKSYLIPPTILNRTDLPRAVARAFYTRDKNGKKQMCDINDTACMCSITPLIPAASVHTGWGEQWGSEKNLEL